VCMCDQRSRSNRPHLPSHLVAPPAPATPCLCNTHSRVALCHCFQPVTQTTQGRCFLNSAFTSSSSIYVGSKSFVLLCVFRIVILEKAILGRNVAHRLRFLNTCMF
jgi:hypothetical protein